MNLQQFLKHRSTHECNGVDTWNYKFKLWLIQERKDRPTIKSLNMWIDLWNDFKEETLSCNYPLNTKPNRR